MEVHCNALGVRCEWHTLGWCRSTSMIDIALMCVCVCVSHTLPLYMSGGAQCSSVSVCERLHHSNLPILSGTWVVGFWLQVVWSNSP